MVVALVRHLPLEFSAAAVQRMNAQVPLSFGQWKKAVPATSSTSF